MATKKPLTVSQNGTQQYEIIAPIDKIFSGVSKKVSGKKPTSFNIDSELLIQFKAGCVRQGRPMSSVIEEMMLQFISRVKC